MVEVTERSNRLGIHGTVVPNQLAALQHALEDIRRHLTDDFEHGMLGNERLKKDPVVSVIKNQTNSPGAFQQVGIGDNFSQAAFAQNHHRPIDIGRGPGAAASTGDGSRGEASWDTSCAASAAGDPTHNDRCG
jgi:hypothetical protein